MNKIIMITIALMSFLNSQGQCLQYGEIDNSGYSSSTNSEYLDNLFLKEKKAIEKYFDIDILLRFDHETDESNAMASTDGYEYGYDGTIMFTMEFLNEFDSEFTLASVFAHEAAHILQYRYDWIFEDEKHDELFCDIMAGIYLNNRNFLLSNLNFLNLSKGSKVNRFVLDAYGNVPFYEIKTALKSMEKFGDYEIGSIYHHGTNEERFHATVAGYLLCANMYNMYRHPWYYPKSDDFYRIVENLVNNRCLDYSSNSPTILGNGSVKLPYFEELLINHSDKFGECERGIFGELESIYFEDVWIDHNYKRNGQKGMLIHVKFRASNLKGDRCELRAMITQNGSMPVDWETGKGVEESIWITPGYENSKYADMEIFISYNRIPIKQRGTHTLSIEILAGKGPKPLGYQSTPENFTITNN